MSLQAEVVRLMKSSPLGLVTAAIGDGGNDVSMIQVSPISTSKGGVPYTQCSQPVWLGT